MTKTDSKTFKLNTGSTVKTNSAATLYPKGGVSKSSYKFSYSSEFGLHYQRLGDVIIDVLLLKDIYILTHTDY